MYNSNKNALYLQGNIQKVLDRLIDDGFELGAQVAIYLEGDLVADVCAGRVASDSNEKVQSNTLFPVCSTGKGIISTLAHILAEENVIDYNKPVVEYWPEFGVNGKENITVRQAMAHQAGIPSTPKFISMAEACDFDAACARLAEMTLEWEPGSTMQYHSRSWGWLVGGIIRKATGRTISDLLLEKITIPLGIENDLFFGINDDGDKRFSPFEIQPASKEQISTAPITNVPPPPGSIAELSLPLMDFVNLPTVRRCCMPAVNGIMSAKAIAKNYASLLGEVDGVRLVPESRLKIATTRVTDPGTTPECFGHGMGLGYCLKGTSSDMGSTFGHGGAGGSEGMANSTINMSVGITKNRMDTHADAPDHTNRLVMQEIRKLFGKDGDGGFFNS
jgi:CubicO group peptidase (beta-lactamase class C family)